MRIAIDIGHAHASGASGNGLQEHEVAAKAADMLARMLRSHDIRTVVVDYPQESNSADLRATIAHINAGKYDAVVSLHCDCATSRAARGAHAICKSVAGAALAHEIADCLCPIMPGRKQTVVQRHDLAILNQTTPPAVLVEMGFLSHAGDARMLRDELPSIVHAIAAGVAQWAGAGGLEV